MICTQGNDGSVDHNWTTDKGVMAYAYDFVDQKSPTTASVVAMKAGTVVNVLDVKTGQTTSPSWGNYITIQHASNEFSHYAHLTTGTFKVKLNQAVTQGAVLAQVGNSGYTLPKGGGYHVHVEATKTNDINAQSVPVLFDDVASPTGPFPGQPISSGTYTS